ncbi:NagM [Bordetella trematum]|uniref:Lipoprotein n=1 Tax=Bordetella trematum TaxID=123899 RepID=A0A157SKM4_9BORD|nr:tripartite tricarboxylate transporter substrate binding protein [Bordetella trematum]AUL46539.1 NagM [Bordetella trematum]AZR93334.1 NagM [Bordetella trematum]NNH20536.1 tripartite tricarboxylate transporter substrate binding protein [Bordetella trematum]QIM71910.1 tripartite tricarboxylate transporter substrate binding protein [Bordetella trematum]SAI19262.1 lipoprotein [Bordetella trematum]
MKSLLPGLALLCAGLTAALPAQAAFPDKPITLVVHFPAGSSTDLIARTLAKEAGQTLGQPIIIQNKPGADGAIAAAEVKHAAPDGYTLLIATNSPMSGVPVMRKQSPYDPLKDFTPITDIGRYAFFLYTRADVPGDTLQGFIDHVKRHPGKLSYGSGNVTGLLSFAYVAQAAGLDILNVPYKGEPPVINDIMGGHLDAAVATAGTGMPQVKAGKFKALATVLPQRSPNAPDVPTMAEAGVGNFPIAPWLGLFGPAGMPADTVERLNQAFHTAMENPQVRQTMQMQDFMLTPSTPQALGQLVDEQLSSHRTLLRATGLEGSLN